MNFSSRRDKRQAEEEEYRRSVYGENNEYYGNSQGYDDEDEDEEEETVFNSSAYTSIPLSNDDQDEKESASSAGRSQDNVYQAYSQTQGGAAGSWQNRSQNYAGSWQTNWNPNTSFVPRSAHAVSKVYVLTLRKAQDSVNIADLIREGKYIITIDINDFVKSKEGDIAYVINFLDGVCYACDSHLSELRPGSGLYMITHSSIEISNKIPKKKK